MNHAQIQQQLALYRYLGSVERAAVDAHVRSCVECAARLRAYEAMDRDLAAVRLPRPGSRAREDFYQALQAESRAAGQKTAWGGSLTALSRFLGQAAGVGVVLLLVLALWLVYQSLNYHALPAVQSTPAGPPTAARRGELIHFNLYASDGQTFDGTVELPANWRGRYVIENRGGGVSFNYPEPPPIIYIETPVAGIEKSYLIFGIETRTAQEWALDQKGPHGTQIASREGIVFVSDISKDNPYNPPQADEYQRMAGQVKEIVGTFKVVKVVAAQPTAAHPAPTAAPSPTSTPSVLLAASIPLQKGNTWVYDVTSYEGPNASEIVTTTYPLTLTVVDVKTVASSQPDQSIYAAKIHGDSTDYWFIVQGNRIYKQENGPDLSKLTDQDSLELILPYKSDDRWVWLPASLPDHPAIQGVFRQVMQVGSVQVPAGKFDNCALFKDGWVTDTSLNWWCPGIGWVEMKSDHNGTPLGTHRVLQKFIPAGSNGEAQAARTALDQFMQARIQRDEPAVLNLLSDKLRANINSVYPSLMQVSNPCWYRYEILSIMETGKDEVQARVRVYEHQWGGDNAGGPPRSWEQGITLINTASGWRVDGLTGAENQRSEAGELHGPTVSACNAAPPRPTATAGP